jgi:hypothetical protein
VFVTELYGVPQAQTEFVCENNKGRDFNLSFVCAVFLCVCVCVCAWVCLVGVFGGEGIGCVGDNWIITVQCLQHVRFKQVPVINTSYCVHGDSLTCYSCFGGMTPLCINFFALYGHHLALF